MQDQTLAVGSADGTITIWEVTTSTSQRPLLVLRYGNPTTGTVSSLACTSSGLLVSGSHDAGVAVWRPGYAQPSVAS